MFQLAKLLPAAVWTVVVVSLLAAAGLVSNKLCNAKVANARLEVEQEYREKADRLADRNLTNEARLRDAQAKIKSLRSKVPDKRECDLPPAAIVQLDQARGVSEAASVDARTAAAPATHLSEPAAAEQWAEDGIAYQRCVERVDQFIEWHR